MAPCLRPACDESCLDVPSGPRRSRWRRLARTLSLGPAVLAAAALITLAGPAGPRRSASHRRAWAVGKGSALVLAALGVRMAPARADSPVRGLVVANHISWLDILVLAAVSPGRNVAKAEIAAWPLVGGLARRAGTVFIRRDRWRELPGVVGRAAEALSRGERVVAFPEATTRCGRSVGTFHRAMFQAAADTGAPVTPVALAYRDRQGRPATWPAFVGDEGLTASLRRVLAMDGVIAEVHVLPAIAPVAQGRHPSRERAVLAALAHRAITVRLGVPVAGVSPQPDREAPRETEDVAV